MRTTAFITALLRVASTAIAQPQLGLVGTPNAILQLNGFHFISGEPDHFLHANHHCSINSLSPVFIQCAVYVPFSNPARLAGIEYIIGEDAFKELDYEERQLWHSHRYEVLSGMLIQAGIPDTVDDSIMQILGNTYGKTFHTWTYKHKDGRLPLGIPEIVAGYTGDSQLPAEFWQKRDEMFGVNSTEISERRNKNLKINPVIDGADPWRNGVVLNLGLTNKTKEINFPPKDQGEDKGAGSSRPRHPKRRFE